MKTATPWKKLLLFCSNPPLKIEILLSYHFLKIGPTLPRRKGEFAQKKKKIAKQKLNR